MQKMQKILTFQLKSILRLLEGSANQPPAPAQPMALEQVLEAEGSEDTPALQFKPEDADILVHCISCGELVSLEAVCHRCGEPLCHDTENCRLTIFLSDFGDYAYLCPTCHADAPSVPTN